MRVILIMLYVLNIGCTQIFSEGDCSDKLIRVSSSSDDEFIANLIERDCGATTAPANILFLKKKSELQGVDGPWGEKVYVSIGGQDIFIRWEGGGVSIEAPIAGDRVFLVKNEWRGVEIKYD